MSPNSPSDTEPYERSISPRSSAFEAKTDFSLASTATRQAQPFFACLARSEMESGSTSSDTDCFTKSTQLSDKRDLHAQDLCSQTIESVRTYDNQWPDSAVHHLAEIQDHVLSVQVLRVCRQIYIEATPFSGRRTRGPFTLESISASGCLSASVRRKRSSRPSIWTSRGRIGYKLLPLKKLTVLLTDIKPAGPRASRWAGAREAWRLGERIKFAEAVRHRILA